MTEESERRTGQATTIGCLKDCEAVFVLDRRIKDHAEQLVEGEERMKNLELLIAKNNKDTASVLEIISLGKGFFKVLGWIGTAAKTLAAIGTPIAAFLYWLKTGSK